MYLCICITFWPTCKMPLQWNVENIEVEQKRQLPKNPSRVRLISEWKWICPSGRCCGMNRATRVCKKWKNRDEENFGTFSCDQYLNKPHTTLYEHWMQYLPLVRMNVDSNCHQNIPKITHFECGGTLSSQSLLLSWSPTLFFLSSSLVLFLTSSFLLLSTQTTRFCELVSTLWFGWTLHLTNNELFHQFSSSFLAILDRSFDQNVLPHTSKTALHILYMCSDVCGRLCNRKV